MYGGRVIRSVLSIGAALAIAGTGAAPIAQAAPTTAAPTVEVERRAGDFLGLVSTTRSFSPNGDGSRDKVVVGIPLKAPARVTITVRRGVKGDVVRRVSLGRLSKGDRLWTWNGRNDQGRVVRDGAYRVTVVATRGRTGQRRDHGATRVVARTTYTPSTVRRASLDVSRTAVYPATREFTDTVQISAAQYIHERDPINGGRAWTSVPAMEIRNSSGRVVRSWDVGETDERYGWLRGWAGTTTDGAPLPAGTYTVVARFMDRYGNTGDGLTRRIEVSASPLVAQQTWTQSLSAVDALDSTPTWYSCSGDCSETCSPTPSSRTPGALTVRSRQSLRALGERCEASGGKFAASVPVALAPLDRLMVSAHGSEHPAGGTGAIVVSLTSSWPAAWAVSTPGTTTTTAGPAFRGEQEGLPTDEVTWRVGERDLGATEYDLHTFDVTVVRYAPSAG